MDFIKKHYEKILLGVVLLGLAVAVVALPFYITSQREAMKQKREDMLIPKVTALANLDESRYVGVMQRLEKPVSLNLSKPHHLLNPVMWQKAADGSLIKVQSGNEVGPEALLVTKVTPLYTTIRLESVGPSGSNYLLSVTREADPNPKKRQKKSAYFERGSKNDFMALTDVAGTADKQELVITLLDTGAAITLTAEKPYQRVDGYSVDFRYEPEKLTWPARRVNDKLAFAGDEFEVTKINPVAADRFEVVISARSTGKKTTKKNNPEP